MILRVRLGTVSGNMTVASLLNHQWFALVIVSKTRTPHDDPMELEGRPESRLVQCSRGGSFRTEDQRFD
jgi:hypothetical protein